jgi:carboxyl-terminal processing protease
VLKETGTKGLRLKGPVRRVLVRWLALAVLVLALVAGAYFFGRSQSPVSLSAEDRQSVELYAEALDTVREDYVDQGAVDPQRQTYGAIRGMLDSLGDKGHTRFLTPEEVEQNRESLSGTYVGVGIQLENEGGKVVVTSPIDGSPADEAGIETGDVIVEVNGRNVEGRDVSKIAERVRGPEGSEVSLTVRREVNGREREREFELERRELELDAASWTRLPGTDVAFLRLSSFSADAAEELRGAIEEAQADGAERFVLDLRDNPGGQVDQALAVAELFLGPNETVYLRQDASGKREEIKTSGDADPIDAPLAVLVNEGTASSAEIVAGALRDNGRAELVGRKTFGTGTVLAEKTLSDGSAILLGVAEWLTPNGDFIRESGISPDIRVALGEDGEPLTPDEAKDLSRREIFSRDAQLKRAVETLEER